MTVWLVTCPAYVGGGWVIQGVFSTEGAARDYADKLVFETFVNEWAVDAPQVHRNLSHYKAGLAPL